MRPRHSEHARSPRASSSTRASRASASETARTATTATRDSINAWVRVYEEDALAAAARADERLAQGDAPTLCGIPIGLKDLYAVAGKPLTASSTLLYEVPDRDCDVWARLAAEGMVLLGHVHTHEFACGGTTDQVGNPWALERSAGGSGGGSSAALASRQVPAATGTDTAGSLRIPSAECGTSTIKPTRGFVSMRGIVPLCMDVRPSRADDPDGRRLRAPARRDVRCGRAGLAAAAPPLRRLSTHLRSRAGRRRRVRSGAGGASRRARRAAASAGTARRPRRLLRSRPHRDARLPPPLRRPARRVSPVESGTARARRADGR